MRENCAFWNRRVEMRVHDHVLDQRLRPRTSAVLATSGGLIRLSPSALTGIGLFFGLLAGAAATQSWWLPALALFAANRLMDGLDGVVARQQNQASDAGAYLDMVADSVVYTVIPLGIAVGHDRRVVWAATAFLLGSFVVNMISWSYLSALLEQRKAGASTTGESTAITMPPGLVEGTETIIWFSLFLLVPSFIVGWMASMAVAVLVGAMIRTAQGARALGRGTHE